MPITTIASYPETMLEFAVHWGQANVALGGTPETEMKLAGDYPLAQFTIDRGDIETMIIGLEDLENDRELATSDRDALKKNLRARLIQFRSTVQSILGQSRYVRAMPKSPSDSLSEGRFLAPLDDMASLWTKIDADTLVAGFTPPMTFGGGYTLAGFTADVAALRAAFDAVTTAERELKLAREDRDRKLEAARERMVQYRLRVQGLFAETDPLFQSLPDLSPAPGSTPDAVTANGVWDDLNSEGVLTWTESSNSNFDRYEVRMTPGPTYDSENNTTIVTYGSGTTEHRTLEGLFNPGDIASFKVYVVLTTANESGSNTVTITRP